MGGRRYYWLRLKKDFFKRHDVRIIESMPNGKDYVLFYLKLLCESVDHEGRLRFSDSIPYSEDMLGTITGTNIDIVRNAIKIFVQLDLMEILDDGTLFMSEVSKLLGSETDWAEKKRQYRSEIRMIADNVPTLSEVQGTMSDKSKSQSKSKNQRQSKEIEPFISFAREDKEMLGLLREFTEMRRKKGKPLTTRAKQMIVTKLQTFPEGTRKKSIEDAILNCWSSVYEHKGPGEVKPVTLEDGETDRILRLTKEMEK